MVAFFGLAFDGDLLAGFPVDFPDDSGPLPFICSWLVAGVATWVLWMDVPFLL